MRLACLIFAVVQYLFVAGVATVPGPYLSVYRIGSGAPTLERTIGGPSRHQAVSAAVDRDGNLYVVDRNVDLGEQRNVLDVYPPGAGRAKYKLRASGEISGVAVDDASVYLAVAAQRELGSSEPAGTCWEIDVYGRKSRTFERSIRDGVVCPGDIAAGRNGSLYVSNEGRFTIVQYAAGASSPTRTIDTSKTIGSLLPDALGNLYALNMGHRSSSVFKYGPIGTDAAVKFIDGLVNPDAIALAGAILYVRDSKAVVPSDAMSAPRLVPRFGMLTAYDVNTGKRLAGIPFENRIWNYQGPAVSTLAADAIGRVYLMQQGDVKTQSGDGVIEIYSKTANKLERVYRVPLSGTPAFILIGP